MSDHYAYIFVRQDISPEYQLIQFGHVACVMGRNLPHNICPHKLNFVGIGVPNEEALVDAQIRMMEHDIGSHDFVEPDLGYQITAVASVPVTGDQRRAFSKYKTLKFN